MANNNLVLLKINCKSIKKIDFYLPQIAKLRRNIWLDTYVNNKLGITKNKIIQNFRPFNIEIEKYKEYIYEIKDFSTFFIVLEQNKLIGYSIVKNTYFRKSLDTLFIDKEFQGNGVGSLLMDEMIKELNSPKIYVSVVRYNEKAINFYKKWGFKYEKEHIPIILERINPKIYVPCIRMIKK